MLIRCTVLLGYGQKLYTFLQDLVSFANLTSFAIFLFWLYTLEIINACVTSYSPVAIYFLVTVMYVCSTVKPLITDSPSNGQPPYNGLTSWHRLLLPYIL